MKKTLLGIFYSFPIQLMLLHFRSNFLLLLQWLLIFAVVGGSFGRSMGFHYFFLDPEYLGEVSFWSFFLIGLTFGVFVIAWMTTTYILSSFKFPFLASLGRPFAKFSFNNSLLPILFIIYYLYRIISFQWYNEYLSESNLIFYCLGFLSGLMTMLFISMIYFNYTNKDIGTFRKKNRLKLSNVLKSIVVKRREKELLAAKANPYKDECRVDYFLTELFRVRIVRDVRHYNFDLLERVFRQNHSNALVLQSLSVVALILMGALVEYKAFRIPTAASFLLLLSIITTLIGALTYWLKEWRTISIVFILVLLEQFVSSGWINYYNKAYGLNYEKEPATYSYEVLDSITSFKHYQDDLKNTLNILDNWRAKFGQSRLLKKPKLVVVCASGGGLRASLWTMQVLRELDKQTKGKLMDHTTLMTGSSGGMLALGYYRELYHQQELGNLNDLQDEKYLDNISRDIANPLTFTFLVNDIFIPWVNREVNGYTYKQDRGYIFEQQFIENTDGLLGMDMGYYREPEREATIPMLFVSPVILNDGRFLIMSPQGVSYMMKPPYAFERNDEQGFAEIDGVDFGALLKDHDADNMRFVTSLRMSATFPLFMPTSHLPTKPRMEMVDAGVRDNFGIEVATRYLMTFRNWIRNNTSGVVIVQIRAQEKIRDFQEPNPSVGDFLNPISSLFDVDNIQDFHHDNYIAHLKAKIGDDQVDVVRFMYLPTKLDERASLSLHLTQREKNDILSALYLDENQESIKELKELLK